MRFWDSSALVALHVQQGSSRQMRDLYTSDAQILAWALSDVEVRSAHCRLEREGAIDRDQFDEVVDQFESFWAGVHLVSAVDAVKARAKRLLGIHPLRAADALQLGAALTAVYDDPRRWEFVCLDSRLGDAARREGFALVP